MEALALILLAVFVAPFIISIVLLAKRSSDQRRIQSLESKVEGLWKIVHRKAQEETAEKPPAPKKETSTSSAPAKPLAVEPTLQSAPESAIESIPVARTRKESPNIVFEPEPETPKPSIEKPSSFPKRPVFTEKLREMGLWPPQDLAKGEAGIIQWWMPRIGGLLLVLTIIFLSVYIAQGTAPWIRFLEVLAADVAVMGAGIFFLSKRPRFGSVLLGTSLAMCYLTSIVAYAAPPVRVIHNAGIGVIAQFAVIIGIFIVSSIRKERGIAFMALAFGFLSSIFSVYEGLKESALLSALALYIVGLFFARRFQWTPLLSLCLAGIYLPVFAFVAFGSIRSDQLILAGETSILAYLIISLSLLPASLRFGKAQKSLSEKSVSVFHGLNTTVCLGIGYLYMKLFSGDLVVFYGSMTIAFTIWAAVFSRGSLRTFPFQLFFLKAAALAALWAANYFSGDIRWFALAIEALLVSWIVIRSQSQWQEAGCVSLWGISFLIAGSSLSAKTLVVWEFDWLLFLSFPVLSVALLGILLKQLSKHELRDRLFALFALLIGAIGIQIILQSEIPIDSRALYLAVYAAVVGAITLLPIAKGNAASIASATMLLAANLMFWNRPHDLGTLAVLLVLSIAAAFFCARRFSSREPFAMRVPEFIFHVAWAVSLSAYLHDSYQEQSWFPLVPPIFALSIWLVNRAPFRTLADVKWVPLLLQLALIDTSHSGIGILYATIILLGSILYLPIALPAKGEQHGLWGRNSIWRVIDHLLVLGIFGKIAIRGFEWLGSSLLLAAAAVAFFAIWQKHRHLVALIASEICLLGGMLLIYQAWDVDSNRVFKDLPWGHEMLFGGLLTSAAMLGIGLGIAKLQSVNMKDSGKVAWSYINAFAAFFAATLFLNYQELSLDSYYTPLIAVFCLIIVGLGIGLKCKAYRMTGLICLLMPVYRLFAYDIQETLFRIVAFAALAVLTIFIGFLYHKFASRIE